ncbi:kinase-like protein [Gonapodya prolifera JEL478]|uniref:Kinase-like protein n=1 Tax=Gonapodya prolifera (strain JEL478) TaxID=1344416 RepID=A0A139AYR4_GONPJ|nr:kinase-like protein [Gonapodya prolifera JEL478]|eukprot:KXS21703.1 kinase-like protein [Gonapodya prolifera JEL478]
MDANPFDAHAQAAQPSFAPSARAGPIARRLDFGDRVGEEDPFPQLGTKNLSIHEPLLANDDDSMAISPTPGSQHRWNDHAAHHGNGGGSANAVPMGPAAAAYDPILLTEDIWLRYEKGQRLGSGAFGSVHLARDRRSNVLVAIKKVQMDPRAGPFWNPTIIREVAVLKSIADHPNVVSYHGYRRSVPPLSPPTAAGAPPNSPVATPTRPFSPSSRRPFSPSGSGTTSSTASQETAVWIVMEYCERDLSKDIKERRRERDKEGREGAVIKPGRMKKLMYQLLEGLAHLHRRQVMHRDIKPSNLLLPPNQNDRLKLADFGLARHFTLPPGMYTPGVVTALYRAPEVYIHARYATGADMWSAGCVLAEMCSGDPPFRMRGEGEWDGVGAVMRVLGAPEPETWPALRTASDDLKRLVELHKRVGEQPLGLAKCAPGLDPVGLDLLQRLLAWDPAKRIPARAALRHPWFDSIDLTSLYENADMKHLTWTRDQIHTDVPPHERDELPRAGEEDEAVYSHFGADAVLDVGHVLVANVPAMEMRHGGKMEE